MKALRKKRTMRELLERKLRTATDDGKTFGEVITDALFQAAASGNVKAYLAIRDGVGERPVEEQVISGTVEILTKEQRDAAYKAAMIDLQNMPAASE